jgi:glycosyltransferase involved in cell wall biosynthesis
VRRADAVVGWWAGLHTLAPFALASALGRPSLLIVGGYDVAAVPEIGYGYQLGGWRRELARFVMRRATRLMTNSRSSAAEFARTVGLPGREPAVVPHGVPDPFGALPRRKDRRLVVSVGVVNRANLERKGHRPFVEAARALPEARFVLAGPWRDGAIDTLRALAPPNVSFPGWVSDRELHDLYRRAAVYVQPSQHEGFGVSVAEAMLAGCVPVVSDRGALPEVVGDAGVTLPGLDPDALAAGVRAALAAGPELGRRARERVRREFPVSRRRAGLLALVDALLAARGPQGRPR